MREVLFRGKCNGEWVYGYYYQKKGKDIYNNEGVFHFIKNEESNHPINPESLGQYTGVDDINGNKIFEGDIVRLSSKPDLSNNQIKRGLLHHEKTAIVVMEKGRWVAKRQLNSGSYYLIWLYDNDYSFSVIGNISDNPELLEEI